MNNDKLKQFVIDTADYVLRYCYLQLDGDMELAEEAFMQVYLQVCKKHVPKTTILQHAYLRKHAESVCRQIRQLRDGKSSLNK